MGQNIPNRIYCEEVMHVSFVVAEGKKAPGSNLHYRRMHTGDSPACSDCPDVHLQCERARPAWKDTVGYESKAQLLDI
jgi:hypothetical protein